MERAAPWGRDGAWAAGRWSRKEYIHIMGTSGLCRKEEHARMFFLGRPAPS